jgi:hypothetical protein
VKKKDDDIGKSLFSQQLYIAKKTTRQEKENKPGRKNIGRKPKV